MSKHKTKKLTNKQITKLLSINPSNLTQKQINQINHTIQISSINQISKFIDFDLHTSQYTLPKHYNKLDKAAIISMSKYYN